MKVFNYASYARTIEKGIISTDMTKLARLLFDPIITAPGVVNRNNNTYTIEPGFAGAIYHQEIDIPENIKKAAGSPDVILRTIRYFDKTVINEISTLKEDEMYDAMVHLVEGSDLLEAKIRELLGYYQEDQLSEFLGMAFLYSLTQDNKKTISLEPDTTVDDDINKYLELIKKYPKPAAIPPPEEIKSHELGYVKELYRVYSEESGQECASQDDLKAFDSLTKHFNRQRKDYYKAETIRRELRDTFRLDEGDGFDVLKDEIYDGIIDTRDGYYKTGFERLNAVMERAPIVPLSYNLENRMLNWVSSGEKKGVCHMLVNDNRISWMEDDDNE